MRAILVGLSRGALLSENAVSSGLPLFFANVGTVDDSTQGFSAMFAESRGDPAGALDADLAMLKDGPQEPLQEEELAMLESPPFGASPPAEAGVFVGHCA